MFAYILTVICLVYLCYDENLLHYDLKIYCITQKVQFFKTNNNRCF